MVGRGFHFFLVFLLVFLLRFPSSYSKTSIPNSTFTPADNFLIDCGATQDDVRLEDGRTFKSDSSARSFLETNEEIQVTVDSVSLNATLNSSASSSVLPLCRSARIFTAESTYTLHINSFGWHWVRLYFYPLPHVKYDLTTAVFTVSADDFVLLNEFSVNDNSSLVFKEYVFNITNERFSLIFKPVKDSYAFINAIEVVTAPDSLISDSASTLPAGNKFDGLFNYAYEVSYRLNVGGPNVAPKNDALYRTWLSDANYNSFPEGAQNVSISTSKVKYPKDGDGATPLIAPPLVYASADQMADAETLQQNFNLTWTMNVDPGFSYLIRLHFCDIVSKSLDDLYFNVYVNGFIGGSAFDLSSLTNALSMAYFTDFVLHSSSVTNDSVMVQVGPMSGVQSGQGNAILNGIEVIKMSNSAGRGFFGDDGSSKINVLRIAAVVGLALGLIALLLLAIVFMKWQKRPQDWKKRNSFSSWLLPIHATNNSTFLSSMKSSRSSKSNKSVSRRSSIFGSRKTSKSVYSGYFSNVGLGRYFTFSELKHATHNFEEKAVIGVGGFGKVYIAELEDGTKTAVKRGNPSSQQGINEFQTEIQMLSKLRHRHLVSLIGFSDENSEMILVYEFMENGPLRDHLYGANKPPLSWKQRLDICIGAARGLHYLHTGASQGIIHRDVKTTNILLDENWVAKVSDFGLSKTASMDQGYVSTAVKGSFGYLDPEYFRKQQLTEKSDVYSFGVVLFEVLCARPVIDPKLPREQVSLAEWAMQWRRKGLIEKIVDPLIAETINPKSLKKYVEAAEKCLSEYGVDRPGMGDVLWNLEYALQLQEVSSEPEIPDDKSTNMIPLDKSTNMIALENPRRVKIELGDSSISVSDDSEVTNGSPMFSQIETFQGR